MSEFLVLDIETSGNEPWSGDLLAVGLGEHIHKPERGRAMARMALARSGNIIVCHTTYDLRWMILDGARLADGVEFHDTKVMAWLLDATQELALDSLVEKYLGYRPVKRIRRMGGELVFDLNDTSCVPIAETPWEAMEAYNRSDVEATTELYAHLRRELQRRELWDMFLEEEVPFSRLLVEIETTGVPFDRQKCLETREVVAKKSGTLREELIREVGVPEFNPASNKQMSSYLYDEIFKLPTRFPIPRMNGMKPHEKFELASQLAPARVRVERVGRDYAHGEYVLDGRGLKAPRLERGRPAGALPSVGAGVLTVMHSTDPFVSTYLTWKKVDRLMSGFLNVWPEQEHGGRIYGRLDQANTVTGRLAGREPNLQQVPSSDEFGIRRLFAGDLVVGDYAGLEVRLSAHFSQEPVMLDIFRSGKDLYGVLAAHAWGGEDTRSNPRRGLMKVIMLGSQYGARGEKLSNVLTIAGITGYTARKADALLKDLEDTLPRLFEWREEVIAEGRSLGYVTTLAGRRRHLPDINSAVWRLMALSERQAVNSKVQGSAADVVRRAMLKARREVDPSVSRIILQVHDEILWERGRDWDPQALKTLGHICEEGHGFELSVPLSFEAKMVQSWAEKEAGPRSPVVDDLEVGRV